MTEEETEELSDIDLYLIIGRLGTENAKLIDSEKWSRREADVARSERDAAWEQMEEAWIEAHVNDRIRDYRERAQAAEQELAATQRVRDEWRSAYGALDDAIVDVLNHPGASTLVGLEEVLDLTRHKITEAGLL